HSFFIIFLDFIAIYAYFLPTSNHANKKTKIIKYIPLISIEITCRIFALPVIQKSNSKKIIFTLKNMFKTKNIALTTY
ncbi:MAG: hypothetical protein ACTTJH_07305, partial [Bacteroidales bacterium]